MSVDDLLKAVAVSSGNDAAVALGRQWPAVRAPLWSG